MEKITLKIKDEKLLIDVSLAKGEIIDEKEMNELSRNYFRGLLKPELKKHLFSSSLIYSGPAGISLEQLLSNPIDRHDFFLIVEMVVDLYKRVRRHSMNTEKIVFDKRYVFCNTVTRELMLIYLPLSATKERFYASEFIRSLIYSAKPKSDDDRKAISEFSFFFNGLPSLDPDRIENYFLRTEKSVVDLISHNVTNGSGFMTDKPLDYYAHYDSKNAKSSKPADDEETGLLQDDEETGLLVEEEEETSILQQPQQHFPTLYRMSNGENIVLSKAVFRIGKEKTQVDYCVENNAAVSRRHVDFITRNGRSSLQDLGSKNHTYINGTMTNAQQEYELKDGDKITLANEEFIFYR